MTLTTTVPGASLRPARPDDLAAVERLLAASGLPLDGVGRVIRLRMDGGPPSGADLAFLMADDGRSFTHDGETWVRC